MILKPLVITMGDPCGIGPEIILKAWDTLKQVPELCFCVIGDGAALRAAGADVAVVQDISDAHKVFAASLPVLDRPLTAPAVAGHPASRHGPHILRWIEEAVTLCLEGKARGLITAPIAKSVLYATGFSFPGHTEYLGNLTAAAPYDGARGPIMMLTAKELRVVLATIHIPLCDVKKRLNADDLAHTVRVTHQALKTDFGISSPRLVMAGLNPHAGEDGTIGREEIDLLKPAIANLQAQGIDIKGPFPADTLFHDEARGAYDACICLYHDQGLIPLKTLDFWGGVNITLGLPIVRTSPDHGTGFGIAGLGIARPDSLIAAIHAAHDLSMKRNDA
ncbi:4-hydroxythreonine-4-phosphate dehydrogenase PdxA [Asticcacaulis sp. ZE23SCel15]|uniref:4-hydroxythreonine-4-phosphate dehydrogenase PdxA n=1 Tax=Asticcacaulis sp. ZE23SCel15 TaxID=3059027 RepID=UPI00265E6C23|nr:4-hydroxythreonine-4-phosphate dehydrogenase PdxA [Asticcacaulis sp. ZE23SCel15]WKL59084.1 4-hydroxythreonine-4-phosphate dehydrogenase PdxA [Asticcacaulis sp. ZE23SCel15]